MRKPIFHVLAFKALNVCRFVSLMLVGLFACNLFKATAQQTVPSGNCDYYTYGLKMKSIDDTTFLYQTPDYNLDSGRDCGNRWIGTFYVNDTILFSYYPGGPFITDPAVIQITGRNTTTFFDTLTFND